MGRYPTQEDPVKSIRLLATALATAILGLAAAAAPGAAAEDPIAARQALMSSNGASAAVAGAILKDELAYSPVVGKSVIASLEATAMVFGDFFPEGSLDPANSSAAPKIWEDPAGFTDVLAKFQQAAAAANTAAGKEGPADKAAFAAAVQPVLETCRSCHEGFRVKK
jgi:cytochrome c556